MRAIYHDDFGINLKKQGKQQEAKKHFQEAGRLKAKSPLSPEPNLGKFYHIKRPELSLFYYKTGVQLQEQGKEELAQEQFRREMLFRP